MRLALNAAACLLAAACAHAGAQPGPALPQGSGAGVHSPDSAFAPLRERSDVVPWSTLTEVKTKEHKGRILPAFGPKQQALNQKVLKVQGFMVPMNANERQTHFLLTSVPLSCPFCLPGGPASIIEVKARSPVKYTQEPVVVEGRFALIADDPYGLYYRVVDAVGVK
jgi:uncharacterized protein